MNSINSIFINCLQANQLIFTLQMARDITARLWSKLRLKVHYAKTFKFRVWCTETIHVIVLRQRLYP